MPELSQRICGISHGDQEGWEVYIAGVERIQNGDDILMLAIGDHDFPTPVETIASCKQALDAGHTKYTPMQGIPQLVSAFAKVSSQALNMNISGEEVVAVAGGQAGLYTAMQATLDPGDHVIVASPHYVTYPATVRAAGCDYTLVNCLPENGFEPEAAAIEEAIRPDTRALLVNSPNNPTCAVYSRKTLEAIADVCIRHDLWLISDEVYWSLYRDCHISPRSLPGMKERTLVILSMSKSHVMTGWRIGWIVAEPAIIHELIQFNLVNSYGLSDFISRAAAEALNNDYGINALADIFKRRGDAFLDELHGTSGIRVLNRSGSMYFMLDIRQLTDDSQKFAFSLLEKENLCVMPGESFGPSAAGHLRISLCQPEAQLREGAQRLRRFSAIFAKQEKRS